MLWGLHCFAHGHFVQAYKVFIRLTWVGVSQFFVVTIDRRNNVLIYAGKQL